MKSLVTGVAGFIGSHVGEHLLKMGHEVVGLDDLSGGFEENVPLSTRFVRGSINDTDLIEVLSQQEKFDYVFHLAAYAAEGLSHFIRHFNYSNNLLGTINLINAAVKTEVRCFVFTSSIAVYGKNQLPMVEDLTPRPEDPYGIAKYAVELDLAAAHEMFGLNYIIFRPHNVYGERQNIADKYRNVVGIFMNQIMQDKPMTIFGDGSQTRAFSHIDDVAPIIARSPEVSRAYNSVFNIGADKPCSVLELAHIVAAAFDTSASIEYLPPRDEVVHAFADHGRVHDVFHPPEPICLEAGIRRMANWARSIGPREPVRFDHIEVRKNMPHSWRSSESS